ncbi:aminopeptidase [Actinoplanes sp. SE50]|uniref:alpha/beta fold hydrolase n=1 Tax=unclassified Actinoplanes TaxID=2626549 RepID=UPI00023ED2AF|nr:MULTISPECIES: alpha/beta hydrolase [unclassified Actinoplanes]AEV86149.1 putative aminopeptidase ybaC [Actinoplanes sp. SE50/110]ATO84547.1 aminopeptidase [Actinoplanes sp. SE50]SLM01957.1 aminopeptidase [Actinoplanes sp. SE50/110]
MHDFRRLSVLLAPAAWGVVAARWTPHGPLTGAEALWSVLISAGVGFGAGRVLRSRWSIPLTPIWYVLCLEMSRVPPDPPHVSLLGVVTALTGRGVHGLLSVFPMALAAAYGCGFRRRRGRFLAGGGTLVLLLILVAVAIPARTPGIPGGVAELTTVPAAGHRLTVMIRGRDRTRPVLLFVPGAPGGSELGAMRAHLAGLEAHFVVATMERRGGGASYAALDPVSSVTPAGSVADILAVTDHLRSRFQRDRIVLLAHSGGSLLAVFAVRQHPEKYAAYVGTGQAVDVEASDQIFYDDILAWARATGKADVVRTLRRQGRPPYRSFWAYEPFLLHENEAYAQRAAPLEVSGPEYTLLQKAHTLNAIVDTWAALYPREQGIDLRRDVPELAVPAYFVQGGREMRGLSVLFADWYATLRAPVKRLVTIPGAGHRAMFEEPAAFTAALTTLLAP